PDDIEKEISVWKKQAALNIVEAQHRNDDLIYDLYTNVINEIFEQFADKHKQFYEMFHKPSFSTYINHGGQEGIQWLSDEINKLVLNTQPAFYNAGETPEKIVPNDTYKDIFIQVNLQEYKYNEKNPFSVSSTLEFGFEPYKYEVKYAGKKIEKRYGEFINADEQKQIIIECVKAVFAEIKEKSGNGKH
ncbi:MAG: hypothetical protein ABIO24_10015, partial [Saprospiraceae bacterium]